MFIHSVIYVRSRSRVYINAHLLYVHAYNFCSACLRKSGSYQFTRKADGEFCDDPLASFAGLESSRLRCGSTIRFQWARAISTVSKIRAKKFSSSFFSANRFPIPEIKDIYLFRFRYTSKKRHRRLSLVITEVIFKLRYMRTLFFFCINVSHQNSLKLSFQLYYRKTCLRDKFQVFNFS